MDEKEPVDLAFILRRSATGYTLDFTYNDPDSVVEIRPLGGYTVPAQLDMESLRSYTYDRKLYGRALGDMLLADERAATEFERIRGIAQNLQRPLRIRLDLDPGAPELASLYWETLRDPRTDALLTISDQIYFTRFPATEDGQPVRLRRRGALRVLALIANPSNLKEYELAPVNVSNELSALEALRPIPITLLAGERRASLRNLTTALYEDFDIIYIVCHGAFKFGVSWLILEDDNGFVQKVEGMEIAQMIAAFSKRPRMVILASCQSAGDSTGSAFSTLGPILASAGVPAVVAMQGQITMPTLQRFMQAFFYQLQRDGRIDRAMAIARGHVRDRDDFWIPILITRLKSGRIWYVPGFTGEQEAFPRWRSLLSSIKNGKCTPILGSGLLDSIVGSSRDLAHRLIQDHIPPSATQNLDDLPQVAQYLAINQDEEFLRNELHQALRHTVLKRFQSHLNSDQQHVPLDDLLCHAGKSLRTATQEPQEPHHILAKLPFKLYLTANPDRLLEEALREEKKDPNEQICPWNYTNTLGSTNEYHKPDDQHPLVYHLFGRLSEPESLVITEDDYFRYLIGVTRKDKVISDVIQRALADSALIFVGFRLDEWTFRVLFQSLMNQEGKHRRSRYTHVAVQIEPHEGTKMDPRLVRNYLERYFGTAALRNYHTEISIYWGSAEEFIRDLYHQWELLMQAEGTVYTHTLPK